MFGEDSVEKVTTVFHVVSDKNFFVMNSRELEVGRFHVSFGDDIRHSLKQKSVIQFCSRNTLEELELCVMGMQLEKVRRRRRWGWYGMKSGGSVINIRIVDGDDMDVILHA